MKKFKLYDEEFVIDENVEKYNKYRLVFLDTARKVYNTFEEGYRENIKSLDEVVNRVPTFVRDHIENIVSKGVIAFLVQEGIMNIDEELFIEKYYYKYFNFDEYFDPILNKYVEITEAKQNLQMYREAQKASRSRWQGGGFGVKGAIKGAVTAGALNLGTDMLRSFGDSSRASRDSQQIETLKRNVFNDPSTFENLGDGVLNCVFGTFYGFIEELEENNIIEVPDFNYKEAEIIFNNTVKYTKDFNKIIKSAIKCIKMYPYEFKYYEVLIENENQNKDVLDMAKYFGFEDKVEAIEYDRDILRQRLEVYFSEEERKNSKYNLEQECEELGTFGTEPSIEDIKEYAEILGDCYKIGSLHDENYPEDNERAFYWYKRGAELGVRACLEELIECYLEGIGVRKDCKKAIELMEEACMNNYDSDFEFELGAYYFMGRDLEIDIDKDYNKAYEHFKKTQKINAKYYIGVMYEEGIEPLIQNLEKAKKCYIEASGGEGAEKELALDSLKRFDGTCFSKEEQKAIDKNSGKPVPFTIGEKIAGIVIWLVIGFFANKYISSSLWRNIAVGFCILAAISMIFATNDKE